MNTVIALIGYKNVGKTTIYNQLTQKKFRVDKNYQNNKINTIDRQHTDLIIFNQTFEIIDTPAFIIKTNRIQQKSLEQTLYAIKLSNIIFFIINATKGITTKDKKIAKILHKKKNVLLIINKTDKIHSDTLKTINFNQLGFKKIHYISAFNKKSIFKIFQQQKNLFTKKIFTNDKNQLNQEKTLTSDINEKKTKITIIGKPNVGKSTLANSLINKNRMVTDNLPGTTKNSVHIPITIFNKKKYILTDTAGIRKLKKINNNIERETISQTLNNIKNSNIILLLVEPQDCTCSQNIYLLNYAINQGCSVIIIVNKCDTLSSIEKKMLKKKILFYFNIIYCIKIHFISALLKIGISSLFFSINQTLLSYFKITKTSKLNKILKVLTKKCPPPLISKTRIKLKFAHFQKQTPLKIIIHGNQTKKIPQNYTKYLIKGFIKHLKLTGTTISILFKENINPYLKIK